MKKTIMSILTVWMLVSSMCVVLIGFGSIENVIGPYTPHAPFRINSNAEFASMAGSEVWFGDGSPGNPYIIEGYDIDGSGYGYCIYIGNTTVYFEVRDSYLHDASGVGMDPYFCNSGIILYNVQNSIMANNTASSNNYHGIYLSYSFNNTITNNTASSNNWYGIYLTYSDTNTIKNNTASNNHYGIYIYESSSNTIENNHASNNNRGIFFHYSDSNTIANNNASSNNEIGIYIFLSSSNTLFNNRMVKDGIYIRGGMLKHWNSHTIDTTNTVNGKPVYYWKNQTGGIVPVKAGQVILANCNNVIIENQNTSDGTVGILLGFSNGNTITNNTASSNNYYGIDLSYSDSNIITNNNATNNNRGIFLVDSNGNTITNNIASKNDYGILTGYCNSNTIANNNASSNNINGIYLSESDSNNIITNNNASNNIYGIFLKSAVNNIIEKNNAFNNDRGLYLYESSDNIIENNTVSSNTNYGIYLYKSSSNNTIFHNNFINNINQSFDDTNMSNRWDNGYPSGGNYWSDYIGVDNLRGPYQNITGSDGIGDTNYSIDSDSTDNYPLMEPIENYTILEQGWNLISTPLVQEDQNLIKVLEMIDGYYNAVQWYDVRDSDDHWKHYKVGKSYGNDLAMLNETKGFWIYLTPQNGAVLLHNGTHPMKNQTITLFPGWNMVGYPSLTIYNRTKGLNNLKFGFEVDSIQCFDAETKTWHDMGEDGYFVYTRGYWIHATIECDWEVPL